jgi:hypothetical protein
MRWQDEKIICIPEWYETHVSNMTYNFFLLPYKVIYFEYAAFIFQ